MTIRLEASRQHATIWQHVVVIHPINSLNLALHVLTTLHCRMSQPSPLRAPFHISPHLELTTFTSNYAHIETKITANNECRSFLVACLVKWVLLNFRSCYEAKSKKMVKEQIENWHCTLLFKHIQ